MTRKASVATLVAVLLATVLTSCASSAQKGALSRAQASYHDKEYANCLERLERAETYNVETPDVISAQVLLYKGLCLEGADRKAEALNVYQLLIDKYPTSSQAAQAKGRLSPR